MNTMKFEKHVFVCTNDRDNGKKSCGSVCGMQMVDALKMKVIQAKLGQKVRVQKAGCLDVCEQGPAMVVYPEGVFYGNVQMNDLSEIFESHIQQGAPVERLQLKFD